MSLKAWESLDSFVKRPDQHCQQPRWGRSLQFALCGWRFMAHPDFLYVSSLVQDYLKHVGRGQAELEGPPSKVSEVLRKVGAVLQKEVEGQLQMYLDSLEIHSVDKASQIFSQVMEEEFADGEMNWGRILTIFVFGGILAKKLQGQGVPLGDKTLEQISHFVTDYIVKTKTTWISENGGWDNGFVTKFEDKSPWLSLRNVQAKLISVLSLFSQYY
uniref:Bcl-2-related protein A1 n=1 Tax=Pogona vitticeps TaxID=103695 RepID=A0A6J0SLW9_9SAUR